MTSDAPLSVTLIGEATFGLCHSHEDMCMYQAFPLPTAKADIWSGDEVTMVNNDSLCWPLQIK